jgi:histidinol-phosphate aminotransferase
MVDINKLVRANVLKMTPYSSARDEFTGKSGIFLDANENPYGNLNRYPDPYQKELKKLISSVKKIKEDQIFLGNGSDEIIDLCFRVFCNPGTDKALSFTPTYGMYEVSASVNDIEMIKIPLDNNFQIDLRKTGSIFSDKKLKLIFICSPNNPTANSMNFKDVKYIIDRFSGIVIIDEAYIDFSEKPSFLELIDLYPNLIILQTFSKAYGLAATRVGMAFTNSEIVRYFNKLKPPYNISTINQKAAMRSLVRNQKHKVQILKIIRERERLASNLSRMSLTEKIFPSDANFLLVKVKNADYVYNELIKRNIIVRNRGRSVENCLRLTVGKRNENNQLLRALRELNIK